RKRTTVPDRFAPPAPDLVQRDFSAGQLDEKWARLEIFQWLTYYNTRRRHSALNYLSPVEFEQQHLRVAKLSIAA
ncbi:IS3 family transposase, partial [Streptomyces sp. NPDC053728]|uniref:IS3 family transposase n=1 Tax=Streptomyces sp. NPDC053728 TaxID=3155534 RepID=UPI0034473B1F